MSGSQATSPLHAGATRTGRTLRLGNPIALVGAIAVGFAAMLLPEVAVLAFAFADGTVPDPEALAEDLVLSFPLLSTVVVLRQGMLFVGALVVAYAATGSARDAIGFRRVPVAAAVAGALGIVGLGPTQDWLIRWLREVAPWLEIGVLDQIDDITAAQPLVLLWPLLALLPGLAEETYFRGLLQHMLGRGALAIVVSGVVFSLFHIDPVHVIGVLPVGIYLAWLGDRAGSLWVPVTAHVGNNTIALLASRVVPLEMAGASEAAPPSVVVFGLLWTGLFMAIVHRVMRGVESRQSARG